jgi:hypothetical protein
MCSVHSSISWLKNIARASGKKRAILSLGGQKAPGQNYSIFISPDGEKLREPPFA